MRLTLMGSLCEYLAALAEHADNSREAVNAEKARSVFAEKSGSKNFTVHNYYSHI